MDHEGGIGEVIGTTKKGKIKLIAYTPKGDKTIFIDPKEAGKITEVQMGSKGSLVSDYTESGEKYGGLGIILYVFRKSRKALVDFPNGIFRVKLETLSQKLPY